MAAGLRFGVILLPKKNIVRNPQNAMESSLVLVHEESGTRWAFCDEFDPPQVLESRDKVYVAMSRGMRGLYASESVGAGAVLLTVDALGYQFFPGRCKKCGNLTCTTSTDARSMALEGPLRRYAHAIADDELRHVGAGLFDFSFVNHSCVPNVWPRFLLRKCEKPRLEYVAIRKIRKGEELLQEYVDCAGLEAPRGFVCSCPRCFGGRDEALFKGLHVAREAAEAAIQARDFFAAAHALQTIRIEDYYPGTHPQVGLHHLRLGKIYRGPLNDPDRARHHLQIAARFLVISHGSERAARLLDDHT